MSHPRYPAYKPSGVPWLGDVPAHWEVTRLRRIALINPVKSEIAAMPIDTETSFVPMEAVIEGGGLTLDRTTTIAEAQAGYTYFRDGDIVVAKITPCFENGKLALAQGLTNGIAFGTTELHVVRASGDTQRKYLYYVVMSERFRKLGESEMYGAGGQKRVPAEFVLNYELALPPPAEQRAIAAYLDRETAQIDALIARLEALVSLLHEKRQALISHAVTRGLNPAAPFKESGVPWLEQVPAHWEVRALKVVAEVRTGVAKGRDLGDRSTITVPYLRVANVQDGYLDLTHVARLEILEGELERYRLRTGDVLMNEGGDNDKLGRGHIWQGEIDPCIHQNHVFAVRPHGVEPEWLTTITGSNYAKSFFEQRAKQTTNLASISSRNLSLLPIVLPPAAERCAIMQMIRSESAQTDALVEKTRSSLDLLRGRRAALITAAVMGQIDLRNATEGKVYGE